MLRTLICLGLLAAATSVYAQPPGQERREDRRADRQDDRAAMHGKIVRYDPAGGVVVVAEGTAPNTREVEYRMDARARYYGPDQAAITNGLKYEGFKPGAEIWYTPGDDAHVLREVRFYDPATAHTRGKVVRIDRDRGIVVVRIGEGPDAKEVEYHVDANTQYWDPNEAAINNALQYQGFTVGTDIWFRPAPNATTIRELRFYDPARRPIRRR
jgi:hypothetical protein